MTEFRDSYRLASLVLVNSTGHVLGQLAPIRLTTPWFQETSELIECVRIKLGVQITILRLLEVDDSHLPELEVCYLAETDSIGDTQLLPWVGALDEQPLRLAYAKPGGPAMC